MGPTLNGSSALQRFECGNALEICNGIMFDFYLGLPHVIIKMFGGGSSVDGFCVETYLPTFVHMAVKCVQKLSSYNTLSRALQYSSKVYSSIALEKSQKVLEAFYNIPHFRRGIYI